LITVMKQSKSACAAPAGTLILAISDISSHGSQTIAKKLVVVMANTDPRNGEELGAPIFQASVAAAMEYDVQVICTATAGRLMKKGVAEKLFVKAGSSMTSSRTRTRRGPSSTAARLIPICST
jgi:predicted GNAT family acetyltransferase